MKKVIYPKLQKLKRIMQIMLYNFYVFFLKPKDNKILITSNTKNELQGNLLYINNELKKYNYNIKVILNDGKNKFSSMMYEFKLLYYVATSKYILIDDFFPLMYVLKIRNGTKFIQVWHALGAFKRVGYSRPMIDYKQNSLSHKNYTDTIVSSDYIIDNYAEAFGISKEKVHALGIPRSDLFFDKDAINENKEKLYSEYPELRNKKVTLFAPTFRGSGRNSAYYPEQYINLDKIYSKMNDDEIFIIKLHPFTKNKLIIKKEYEDKIIDLTNYSDINTLLLITDLLITDYSSVIFEYAFLEKPIIFYVPDLEEYSYSRNFYYPYEEYIYGQIAKSQNELMNLIGKTTINEEKMKLFKEKFLNKCDGNSTKRFVEELILK